jgi:hypothetical protein
VLGVSQTEPALSADYSPLCRHPGKRHRRRQQHAFTGSLVIGPPADSCLGFLQFPERGYITPAETLTGRLGPEQGIAGSRAGVDAPVDRVHVIEGTNMPITPRQSTPGRPRTNDLTQTPERAVTVLSLTMNGSCRARRSQGWRFRLW